MTNQYRSRLASAIRDGSKISRATGLGEDRVQDILRTVVLELRLIAAKERDDSAARFLEKLT